MITKQNDAAAFNNDEDVIQTLSVEKGRYIDNDKSWVKAKVIFNDKDIYMNIRKKFHIDVLWPAITNGVWSYNDFQKLTIECMDYDTYNNQIKIEEVLNYCKSLSNCQDEIEEVIDFLPYKSTIEALKKDLQIASDNLNLGNDIEKNIKKLQKLADLKIEKPELKSISNDASNILANAFYDFYVISFQQNQPDDAKQFLLNAIKLASFAGNIDTCTLWIRNAIYMNDNSCGNLEVREDDYVPKETIYAFALLSEHSPEATINAIEAERKKIKTKIENNQKNTKRISYNP